MSTHEHFSKTPNFTYLTMIKERVIAEETKVPTDTSYVAAETEQYVNSMAEISRLYSQTLSQLYKDPHRRSRENKSGKIERFVTDFAVESTHILIENKITEPEFPLTVEVYTPISYINGKETIVKAAINFSPHHWEMTSNSIQNGIPILSSPPKTNNESVAETQKVARKLRTFLEPYLSQEV